ncbi:MULTISPECIES: hypothetical protein [Haloferax]|uniref:Uncharacterized protein n=1 Tax=Haloferax marinum TaxID=2666143 RepID=A0A6A8G695_9EURY|nr:MULTISPECIES: hypothetical protein [Haloferax]KAB1197736.1 hypothetical protein Hfx1150_09455 [Haloferax sp. CBA1150]MRW96790.1 hypothetical protein [Haloferax marinum]
MLLDILYLLIIGTVGCFFIGYMTPKFAIWGSITTAVLWMTAHLIPAFSPDEVLSTMAPRIVDLFLVFPTAIQLAWDSQVADVGLVGGLIVLAWGVAMLIPYFVGIVLGILTWPELILFRIIL